ncbi:ABC transporter ATP-binding protein [Ilyobacter polytropus]|uniref:Oligopeptide/dipeptide ABC transporter, ATPase subunit n=1 Tax=Ilyobacter polytropus (strain ATCC 51220 / DSM 2926 / LMG 16218 / CuHBu1) TaxID=572544 RepID=E3H8S1_ILYPC|nr:ABC transporter ATP-binding protein [Ilyobacter polytropus]ADO83335.1 oligopeptide/dipeptide ABC transporter, ATPase subunit [Ilyobacter polytropus DSM 2926]
MDNRQPILEIKDLKTYFYTDDGVVKGCDGVSYKVYEGETLALVGESGSGKSVSAMSILQLIPSPPGKIVEGEILYNGDNLVNYSEKQMEKIRGNDIAVIFQEPMTSLNPVLTAGYQIMEPLRLHQKLSKNKAKERAVELLKLVGIPSPEKRFKEYPYQMSGGMRQRVVIAIALACNPKLLIADEPTTALDVTIQAQIINLVEEMQEKLGMAILMITHDLGVVAETANKVAVMYCGKIVEYGRVDDIFYDSKHPYLQGLKKSMPRLDSEKVEELYVIEGMVPNPLNLPVGCKFADRCEYVMEICRKKEPEAVYFGKEHYARCFLYSDSNESE